jgi:type IV pilus assembly protein PilP
MNARRLGAPILAIMVTAGCGEEHQDLREFVRSSDANVRGRVEPLPRVTPYEPFSYNAAELPDPFRPRKDEKFGSAQEVPKAAQREIREDLESYPLENLKMVGTLQDKNKNIFALIRTPENVIYQVKAGNYLGQNFGVISKITETSIVLKEVIQDNAGVWSERTSSLQLLDE